MSTTILADVAARVLVPRRSLVARMQASGARGYLVVAPAGSGKSTLLQQLAAADDRPVVWVRVSTAHADPLLLLADIGRAIADAMPGGPVEATLARLDSAHGRGSHARLTRAMAAEDQPAMLVLDDMHLVNHQLAALDVITGIVDGLPAGWTIAIAQREVVALPTARWQLDAALLMVGYEDLIFDDAECRQALVALGVAVTDDLVAEILERTEGWPAGVYLAGLAIRSERPLRAGTLVAGDDELVRSFLDSEILSMLEPEDREVLLRTAIVDEVDASLAEALTDDPASGERLARIAEQNLLVRPVDRQQRWFRCHSLLRERLLRALDDAGRIRPELHARASMWYEEHERPQDAIAHAFESEDRSRVERLVIDALQEEYRAGRVETFRSWLDRFGTSSSPQDVQLAFAATWFTAVEGDADGCTRWSTLARLDDAEPSEPADDRDGLDRWILRALLFARGPQRALEDATRSLSHHDDLWRWQTTALTVQGAAHASLGDEQAAAVCYEAVERAPGVGRAAVRLCARAERALRAMDRRAWAEAEQILALDRAAMFADPTAGRLPGTLWLCADARMSLHRGDVRGTVERLRRAQMARLRLTWCVPWFAVRCLGVMAHTELLVGDIAGAHASIAQARDILRVRPHLGLMVDALDGVAARARESSNARASASSLSPAELRLLPFIQTYLSFKEIGQRLGISVTTVKTEVRSIHAKLDASSRSEAVEIAVACGLLEDPFA